MKAKIHELYLDYFNNFLSVARFAEYYSLTDEQAIRIIRIGQRLNYRIK